MPPREKRKHFNWLVIGATWTGLAVCYHKHLLRRGLAVAISGYSSLALRPHGEASEETPVDQTQDSDNRARETFAASNFR